MQCSKLTLVATLVLSLLLLATPLSAHPGDQHGPNDGHLVGTGEWGTIDYVSHVTVHDAEEGLIADLTVFGDYAYLARWGGSACAGPERRGQQMPDGGVYVIDIADLSNPREVGFIATHQDTLVGEGMQVIHLATSAFTGDVLAINHEGCGKNFKAGFSLWDVTNPLRPKKLSEHLADFTVNGVHNTPHDANQYHSVFMWQDNGRAYLVATDDDEAADVDIFDITRPKRPVLIGEFDLNQAGVAQPEFRLTDSFLHDMIVKEINGQQIMLLSYWDGGYVLLNVDNPASPIFLGDSDYAQYNAELQVQTGLLRESEGNGHQAEFTADNSFFIATDEDFDPFVLAIQTSAGDFPARIGSNTTGGQATAVSGPTVFVGRACPGDPAVPAGNPNTYDIAVVERGLCFFTEKLQLVEAAGGWDAVVIMNREGADACAANLTPTVEGSLPVVSIPRDAGYALFGTPYDQDACMVGAAQAPIAIGATGGTVDTVDLVFDGWGYVHLFATDATAGDVTDVDTFAIPEAMSAVYANNFGDLSVHEVATHLTDPNRAYLSYYAGGIRALEIQCTNPADKNTCALAEVGGYLDPAGNNFWGVDVQIIDGVTYIFGSDRDSGLWIFRDNTDGAGGINAASAAPAGASKSYLPLVRGK